MNRSYKRVIAILLIIANTLSLAAESRARANRENGARLIEAAKYLEQSQQELDCSASGARRWAKKAESALRNFRGGSAAEGATAAVLRARISVALTQIERRQEALNDAARQVPKLLDSRLINSAILALDRVEEDLPTCDPRFKDWRRLASDRYAAASQLVREGDDMFQQSPRQARKLYEAARKINVEQPDVDLRIRQAKDAARSSGGGHAVLKTVAWTLVIAAIVGGAAYAEQQRKRQEAVKTNPGVISPK